MAEPKLRPVAWTLLFIGCIIAAYLLFQWFLV